MRFTEEEFRSIIQNSGYTVASDTNPVIQTAARAPAQPDPVRVSETASTLEHKFMRLWERLGGDLTYVRNYRFDLPDSRMELDVAWPALRIGIEINGGQAFGHKSGHGNWAGLERDAYKQNRCVQRGWTLFWLTTSMLTPSHVQPLVDFVRHAQETSHASE